MKTNKRGIFEAARSVLISKWLDRDANIEFNETLLSRGAEPFRVWRPKEAINRALLWVDQI